MALIDKITAIGDAIREKNGTTELIPFSDMPRAILDIVTGGGAELDIAYGENPPEDTSKLWVKVNEPDNVKVSSVIDGAGNVEICDTHLLEAVHHTACAKVGKKIYVFGGNIGGTSPSMKISVFDTETNTITETAVNFSLYETACASVGTKIYLFGGRGSGHTLTKQFYEFDTETQTKTSLGSMSEYSACASCVAIGTKIYLFGGNIGSGIKTDKIKIFDTQTKEWTTLAAKLPIGCENMACACVGNKIYLFGGYSDKSLDTVNVFDTQTHIIKTLTTTLPKATDGWCGANIGTKIYLFGGYGGGYLDTILVFDTETETETITTLNDTLPIPIVHTRCACIGNKVYIFGGEREGVIACDTINIFTLTHELAQGNIELQSSLMNNNKFKLINTENAQVEIGVENVYVGNENNEAELCDAYLHNGTEWVQI